MTSEEYNWLLEADAKIRAGEAYTAEPSERDRLLRLAPQCGFDDAQVTLVVNEPGGIEKLIVTLRERVGTSSKKLSKALAALYVAQDADQRTAALAVIEEIAVSDPVELHREEARKTLAAVDAGQL